MAQKKVVPFLEGDDPFAEEQDFLNGPDPFAADTQPEQVFKTSPVEHMPEGVVDPKTGEAIGLREDKGALANFAGAFNHQLASWLGVPVDAVDAGLKKLGMKGLPKGYTGEDALTLLMKDIGIDARAAKDKEAMAEKIGKSTLDGAVWTAALVTGAGLLRAVGAEAVPILGRLTQFLTKQPAKTITLGGAAGAGAPPGGELGKEIIPEGASSTVAGAGAGYGLGRAVGGPFGAVLGGLIGGTTGGIADAFGIHVSPEMIGEFAGGATTQAAANRVGRILSSPFEFAGRLLSRPAVDPLRPFAGDIKVTKQFALDQIDGDLKRTALAVDQAIQSVPRKGSPSDYAQRLQQRLLKVERIASKIGDKYWERVPKGAYARYDILQDTIKQLRKELAQGSPRAFPEKAINEIEELIDRTKPVTDPKTGRMVRQGRPITVARLLALRSDILNDIRAGKVAASMGDPKITDALIGNWRRLQGAIIEQINAAIPDNIELKQARAYTKAMEDLFSRTPIAQITARTKVGGMKTPAADSVEALLSQTEGPQAVKNVSEAFPNRGPNRSPLAAPSQAQGISKDFEDTIRAMFREAADVGSTPEEISRNAQKFIDSHLGQLTHFSNVADELNSVSVALKEATDARDLIAKSALSKFTQSDPAVSVKRVFDNENPRAYAEELMKTFVKDKGALDGLKGAMLDELMDRTKASGARLMAALNPKGKFRGAMEAVFSPEEINRLDRIAKLGAELESGEGMKASRFLKSGGLVGFRIAGAMVGRWLSRQAGGGTIQVPAITSNLARTAAEKIFQIYKSTDLVKNAVLDPSWEKFFYARMPSNLTELRIFNLRLRRLLAGSEVARQKAFEDEDTGGP